MTVQGRRRDDRDGLRIGLTVTKRVGHATERNRIKRRLREATRLAVARDALLSGHAREEAGPSVDVLDADVVVIGRRPVLTADFEILIEDFTRALHSVTRPGGVKPGQPKAGSGSRSGTSASHPRRGRSIAPSHSS